MSRLFRINLDGGHVHDNMTLDVVVDDKRRLRDGVPFCGWWGKIGSTSLYPVILLPDGRIDPGSDDETDQHERFGNLAIHGRSLEIGDRILFEIWGDTYNFEIKKMLDLLDF